jgi:hypothetical protein
MGASTSLQWRIDTLNPCRYWVVSYTAHRLSITADICLFPPGGLQSPFGRDRDAHRAPPVSSSQTTSDGEGELWAAGHVGAVQTAGWPRYRLATQHLYVDTSFPGGGGPREKELHHVRFLGLASKSEVKGVLTSRGLKLRPAEFECAQGKLVPPPPRLFLI